MKAQFATIEASISLVAIVSALAFVSAQLNNTTAGLGVQSALLQRNTAVYDAINALERNLTWNDCAAQLYLYGGAKCADELGRNLSVMLGVGNVNIEIGNAQAANSQNETVACRSMLLEEANMTESVCVSVSSR